MKAPHSLDSSLYLPKNAAALQTSAPQVRPPPNQAGGALMQTAVTPPGDPVALSDAGKNLARQEGLTARANDLGNATIDAAEKFITNFAKSLFGDAAKGMTLSFDSASVSAHSGFSATAQHGSGPGGSSDSATFSLEEGSSFVGSGQITTADGHRFTFEVEVRYQSTIQAAYSTSNSEPSGQAGRPAGPAHGRSPEARGDELRAHFPGNIADFFHLFDQSGLQLSFQSPADAGNDAKQGNLTLRLIEMLASPVEAKVARAYGDQPAQDAVAAQA